ncbi:MAG: hypothetical protein U1F43_31735 [Myxococcota bacterium]
MRGRPSRATGLAVLAVVASLGFGCDFGIGGSGGGCVSISQGDYTMPVKRIIQDALAVRVTQSGLDFLTARIKTLVLTFFHADANGRAVVPLADLGLGSIGTSIGPFDASVRDLVVTLDLARLSVRLVQGSSPARIEITVIDAEVGLVDGTVAGGVDGTFFSGDAACGLANGPDGRVALLSMTLVLELATTSDGLLEVHVLPSQFDLQDIALSLVTDCDRPECLDGLSPGDTGECLECETICPAVDIGAQLASTLQDAFDGLFDQLLNLLADDLANLVLDDLLNGKPLAVEGELPLAKMLGPVLAWMKSARPLGVLGRPAGQAFRVTGFGDALGLDLVMDAGLDAAPAHPCIGDFGADRVFVSGPRPTFDGLAFGPDGGPITYDVGVGVSAAVINEGLWALWKSGTLCIDATTDDVVTLTSGKLVLTAGTLDLLLPGAADIAGPDAPIRITVRPHLAENAQVGDVVRLGQSPLLTVRLDDSEIGVEALVGDAWLRLVSFRAGVDLSVGLEATVDQKIAVSIDDVALRDLRLPDDEIFHQARLDIIAPFVVDLALGVLSERPLTIDLGLSGLGSSLGLPLVPVVEAIAPAGDASDWLAIYLKLEDPPAPEALAAAPDVTPLDVSPGMAMVLAEVAPDARFELRVGGGPWSRTFVGPGPHLLTSNRLWLLGTWPLEARSIDAHGHGGDPRVVARLTVERPPYAAERAGAGEVDAAPEPDDSGCAGAGVAASRARSAGWRCSSVEAGVAARAASAAWRSASGSPRAPTPASRPSAAASATTSVTTASCAARRASASGRRRALDGDCCPGAVCFSGWCRPTAECGPGRPCEGLGDVCVGDQCVPTACDVAQPCAEPFACMAGRCLARAPCDGRCGADEVCDAAADRCLAAPGCAISCDVGWRIAAWEVAPDALSCGEPACACGTALAVPQGRPGVDGRLATAGETPLLVSYEPVYGDLVLSRFDAQGARSDTVLDGAPDDAPAVALANTYRGGILAPGPDRGTHPALATGGVDGSWDVVYRDEDEKRLRHLRFDPATGRVVARSDVPIAGDVGRYSCLVRDGASLSGLAFVSADPSDTRSQLVRFQGGPEGWSVATVLETDLPPRAADPCGGACGFGALCVLDGGAEACGDALQLSGCDVACGPHEECVAVGGAPAACHTRVYPRYAADRLPFGEGLFVSCDADVAAWYDADRQALVVARAPFGAADRQLVDSGPDRDSGRHADIVRLGDGRVVVVHQEAIAGRLRAGIASDVLGSWSFEDVDAGGAWADVAEVDGHAVVVHGEPDGGDIRVAARLGNCWATAPVLVDGGFAYPTVTAVGAEAWLAALAFAFEDDLDPAHHPVLERLSLPASCAR